MVTVVRHFPSQDTGFSVAVAKIQPVGLKFSKLSSASVYIFGGKTSFEKRRVFHRMTSWKTELFCLC